MSAWCSANRRVVPRSAEQRTGYEKEVNPMSTTAQNLIARYFAADARRDTDALVALFTDDAVVIDEGQARHGASEIRAWRAYVSTTYQFTTELLGVQPVDDDNYIALAHLEGNFPGGTVDLKYRFTIDGKRIRRLEIAP